MKYINVKVTFLPHDNPEVETRVREGCKFLETMINSQMFKDMVLEGSYNDGIPNQEIYERFTAKDLDLVFEVSEAAHMKVGFSVDKITDVISVYPHNLNYPTHKIASTIAHEYGHIVEFHHTSSYAGTFSYSLLVQGERLFRKFYKKLKGKSYPKKGKWLVYEPWCKLIWFWKVLKWKDIK